MFSDIFKSEPFNELLRTKETHAAGPWLSKLIKPHLILEGVILTLLKALTLSVGGGACFQVVHDPELELNLNGTYKD